MSIYPPPTTRGYLFNPSNFSVGDTYLKSINNEIISGKYTFNNDVTVAGNTALNGRTSVTTSQSSNDSPPPVTVNNTGTNTYTSVLNMFSPNALAGQRTQLRMGTAATSNNCYEQRFYYNSNASTSNRMEMAFYGQGSPVFCVTADQKVGINTTAPSAALHVSGDINTTSSYNLNGSPILTSTLCKIGANYAPAVSSSGILIKYGTSGNVGGVTTGTVSFGYTFASAPYVSATQNNTVPVKFSIAGITTTGFTYYFDTAPGGTTITWIAIGS